MPFTYEPYDITIITSNSYLNPYLDVSLNATFFGPTKTITINGFWDGGTTWKIRIAPTEVGTWSYITTSNDAQLNNKTGSFNVIDSGKKGFIIRDPLNKFAFKRANGENVLLMGDTNWNSMSDRSRTFSNSIFKQYINIRASQKFNFMRTYMVPFYSATTDAHYNEGGPAFNPWNPDNINPGYFQEADRRILYANSKGIIMHLVVGADQTLLTTFFGWGNGKMERYIKYLTARYGAYDIAWEGRTEFEEQGSTPPGYIALANQIGNWIEVYDPYDHIQSTHTLNSNNELGNELWLDWIMHQSQNWSMIIGDRVFNKPVMNEEFYYEAGGANPIYDAGSVIADTMRKGAWIVMTYGASGFAYANMGTLNARSSPFEGIQYATSDGATYMTYLYNFWSKTNYIKLSPKHNLASSGYLLGTNTLGKEYIIYLPNGGSTTVDLTSLPGLLQLEWYNPRTGTYQGQTTVQGGTLRSFTSPDSNDWVLHVYCPTPLCDFTITQ